MYRGPIVLPLLLIAAGILLLLANLGYVQIDVGELVRRFWPLLLVALGLEILLGAAISRRTRATPERVSVGLDGAQRADLRIVFGAGVLLVGPAASGMLVQGTLEGGVRTRRGGPGEMELRSDTDAWWGGAWRGRPSRWDIGVTTEVPLALRIETGASRAQVDLAAVRLTRLVLRVGASETSVRLPVPQGHVTVEADIGAASVGFELPPGVAARVHSTMGLGSSDVDERRFERHGRARVTPGFDTAADRLELDIRGGVGSVSVR
jgi:hypothetical protein